MTTCIQHIETYWTKISRGHPGATVRNAVPEKYSIEALPDDNGVCYQHVCYSEWNGFQPPIVKAWREINEHQQREIGFDFKLPELNQLVVSKWVKRGCLKRVGDLAPGSWLKIISNERLVLESTWAYKKHVFNIYFGDPSQMKVAFLLKAPAYSLNLQMDLW